MDVHEPNSTASEGKDGKVLAVNTSEDVINKTVEAGVAKTSGKVTASQREILGCLIMRQMMEEHRQWENTLA